MCEEGLNKEIKYLKFVFTKVNGYPSRMVYNTLQDVIKKMEQESNRVNQEETPVNNSECVKEDVVYPHISFPYKGKGKSKCLPETVKPRFTYKGKQLSSIFHIMDKVKKEHQSNLIYSYS